MSFTQSAPLVPTNALWTWSDPPAGNSRVVLSYPTVPGCPTKSGMTPVDLQSYMLIPIQQYGNPSIPVSDNTIYQWIRWAEDEIEQETNVRLCQTWIAAPAAKNIVAARETGLVTTYNYQQLGLDYDFAEAGYDFIYERWRDEGWGFQRLRWRPVKEVEYVDPTGVVDPTNSHGLKSVAFIYPLLNEYFRMPDSWIVEDQNRGLVRFVPSTNVQMLPLFAMQLSFMGFAQSVPGGLWFQYTAGLTAVDYQANWSFMSRLVLAKAAITAFGLLGTSVNLGAIETQVQADGLMQRLKYSDKGVFAAQIAQQESVAKDLLKRAKQMGGGFSLGLL